ncbi:uncharacterized protein LOC142530044 isoform X2 [Primulina tabacum]|uniref:uncharacterized protein LOC142530044 isoform X2 n=1 Tax=Primulina tabacum TaxID=48773 RepID=UPI003F595B34
MAVDVRCCGGSAVLTFSLRRSQNLSYQPPQKITRRFITSAVLKRSPKRLKYSTPRFAKEDGLLYVKVDPAGSDSWKLDPMIELLKEGAVGVIPTDTVYALVCDLRNNSAIERLRRYVMFTLSSVTIATKPFGSLFSGLRFLFYLFRIKDIQPTKPLSILCRSFRDIDTYTTGFPQGNGQGLTNIFRAVKHCLPGPYTFILTASKELPKQCIRHGAQSKYASRKNVGVRIPDDPVCQAILEKIDEPLISTSVKSPKDNEWILDPVVIADVYGSEGLDFVVDAGMRIADPSTVVDMTGSSPQIIRHGKSIAGIGYELDISKSGA